jgi:hypothetical protein
MAMAPRNPSRKVAATTEDGIHIGWTVARICGLVLALVLFNRYALRLGVIVAAGDPTSFVPLLPPDVFAALLLRLNVWWGLTLTLYVVNLYVGRWMSTTRVVDCALAFFGMFILAKTISSPLLGASALWLQSGQSALAVSHRLLPVVTWLLRGTLAAALMAWLALTAAKLQTLSQPTRWTTA